MKLPKVYEPSKYEADIYALWEKSQAFQPRKAGKSFSVVVPPPNANANLHIGFALTMTLQDIAVRYHRLLGESVLFVPGADHAGFETQAVYEKHLAKEGKSRFDFSREELYQNIWDFVAKNRQGFEEQFRSLGGSVDWTRFAFTLDDKIVKRAYATFKKMWDEGLVYRGERLVNYCTFHGTAFADVEVEYKEAAGKLWYIRYPLTDGSGEVVVATTRPETMLGDTAVAVNVDDERYTAFHGKTIRLPITGREVPIIADKEFVDPAFGTGAVKITPAHDANDFALAERTALPMITIIDHEGKLNSEVPSVYRGLSASEARTRVVADLEEQGFLVKTEDYTHNVGHCYKCGTVIEPMLRDQWFVDMKPLAKRAIEALKAGTITFYPAIKKNQLIAYLENLRDWNISRQIAWGIPIPAFQNVDNPDDWIYNDNVQLEIIEQDGKTYRRDPDVFDTWFSSSSWPYATLDFPDSEDFKQFYPLSFMDTGGEILYPWVSRMVMLGLYITDEVPFTSVYIHGYVMAADGSKMSKSLGNVINAPELIEQYGADALRMGMVAGRAAAVNRGYDSRKVEDARNFANKLWNIARYIEDKIGQEKPAATADSDADHWILQRLNTTVDSIDSDLTEYRFAEAYEAIYHFVWDDVADWYIEASKVQPNNALLAYVLEATLKLTHPFAPFVTETIWQTLHWSKDTLLATSAWPTKQAVDYEKVSAFSSVKDLISEIRGTLKSLGQTTAGLDYTASDTISANADVIQKMARIGNLRAISASSGLKLTGAATEAWLVFEDDAIQSYLDKLEEKQRDALDTIATFEKRLSNPGYVQNAPKAVVEQTQAQLKSAQLLLETIQAEQQRFTQ